MKLGGNLPKEVDIFPLCIILRRLLTGLDSDVGQVTAAIDILTEDALIEIFDFYSYRDWHTLVHVYRRWRNIVFGSSGYLALMLLCKPRTPVRQLLHIWPPLPITIAGFKHHPTSGLDNVVAALEQNDRVCDVTLHDLSSIGRSRGHDAAAIPRVGISRPSHIRGRGVNPSRFVLGWICTRFGSAQGVRHSISGITKTTFDYPLPRIADRKSVV